MVSNVSWSIYVMRSQLDLFCDSFFNSQQKLKAEENNNAVHHDDESSHYQQLSSHRKLHSELESDTKQFPISAGQNQIN